MGRPRSKTPRDTQIQVRVTAEQLAYIDAHRGDLSRPRYLLRALGELDRAQRPTPARRPDPPPRPKPVTLTDDHEHTWTGDVAEKRTVKGEVQIKYHCGGYPTCKAVSPWN